MERLNGLIQKKSIIEAKMFTSSQNIENAFIYAEKALAFAFGRRLQGIGEHQKVGAPGPPPSPNEVADEFFQAPIM